MKKCEECTYNMPYTLGIERYSFCTLPEEEKLACMLKHKTMELKLHMSYDKAFADMISRWQINKVKFQRIEDVN